jgi:hypothetical protein
MIETIAGVQIPDSRVANAAAELIRQTTTPLIYHHSRRVFLFGSLQSRQLGIQPDAELLYIAALFHDSGLVPPYRGTTQRFELDSADAAKSFLTTNGFSDAEADVVWTAIALHTTPEVPYKMAPVIAATTAGVETDVLGIGLDSLSQNEIDAVTAIHPRPDFKNQILQAFTDGFQGVAQATCERRIGALQVSVEPRDAKRIMRKIKKPDQFVVNRAAALVHGNLV